MKPLLSFLKSTLLGGLLLVLPIWLAVLLVAKALLQLQVFVKPVSSHLPESVAYPRILAIVLLLALCFIVGLLIQTTLGARVKRIAQKTVLEKLPGYTTLHGIATQIARFEETERFRSALVEIEDALVPCFIIEQHPNDRCTVFVPSVPTPLAGALYIIANSRVHALDVPLMTAMKVISKWGAGSNTLLAAYDAAQNPPQQQPNPA